MELTRDYFEKHPQWSIHYETVKNSDDNLGDWSIWVAKLHHECGAGGKDDHTGRVALSVTNSMYEWRFALAGEINGTGEGYFSGTFFACTVEELEGFFKLSHFDAYQYTL